MSVSDGKNGLVSGVGNTPFMGPIRGHRPTDNIYNFTNVAYGGVSGVPFCVSGVNCCKFKFVVHDIVYSFHDARYKILERTWSNKHH